MGPTAFSYVQRHAEAPAHPRELLVKLPGSTVGP